MLGAPANVIFTTCATVSLVMPRFLQYVDCNQRERSFAPLLELQGAQHRAMFSRVTMRASLMICSQVATALWLLPKSTRSTS
jgi:hypothetical protein